MADSIRYHSSDDMTGLGELAGVTEPVAVVIRPDGSVDAYGYMAVVDQRAREVVTVCICGQLPALEPGQCETTELVSRPTDDPLYDESVQQELEARAYAGPACILTGAPGESDDDCTTHEHEPITRACEDCGAEPGEPCRPDCLGQAAHLDEIAPTCEECGARTDALVSDEHDASCSLYSGNVQTAGA